MGEAVQLRTRPRALANISTETLVRLYTFFRFLPGLFMRFVLVR